jgi:hypothetical protein
MSGNTTLLVLQIVANMIRGSRNRQRGGSLQGCEPSTGVAWRASPVGTEQPEVFFLAEPWFV